jgi:hypothetical protein
VSKFKSDSETYLTVTADEYEVDVRIMLLPVSIVVLVHYFNTLFLVLGREGNRL